MIRIIVADDQSLIRDGLKTVLDMEKDLQVVSVARNGAEALEQVSRLKPDVLLLDIRMPVMDGVECMKRLGNMAVATKVLMLTTFDDEEYIIDALAWGARGFLLKDAEMKDLIEAIRDASNNKMVIPESVASRLAEGLAKISAERHSLGTLPELNLSERETEIANMMVRGFTNKQIASALYLSEGTTRNYISEIYAKIGINDRTQAVLYLKEQGIK